MLRESSAANDKNFDLHQVTQGGADDSDIPQAGLLVRFAEAVVSRDPGTIATVRDELRAALGEAALIDAAAVASAFHGFVRVADSIGIPYDTAAGGKDSTGLQADLGIDQFYRARN